MGDNSHFTAVVRLPNAWLHYDGMKRPQLQLHSLDIEGTEEAMHQRALAQIFYEVMDENEQKSFGSEDVDYSSVFQYNTSDSEVKLAEMKKTNKTKKMVSPNNEAEGGDGELEWTDQDQRKGKHSAKKERIPVGWSVRSEGSGTRGPLPTCKGCKGKISRDAKCIRHSDKKNSSHKFTTVDQYHCKVGCLSKVKRAELKKLTRKHWTDQRVATVAKKLDSKLSLSP